MAIVPPTVRPVMTRVQRAGGRAVTLRKAWRAVHDEVRCFEKGMTRPTRGMEQRQVGQMVSLGLATMHPHAPQRGSCSGLDDGFDLKAPRRARIKRTNTANAARATKINGG